MTKFAIRLSLALKSRWENAKEHSSRDRGDISITTIIIAVAVIAGAITVAGSIGLLIVKYNAKLTGI